MRVAGTAALALATALVCSDVAAERLVVGQGSTLSLGTSRLDLGCSDLAVAGTLDLGGGIVSGARDVGATGSLRGGTGTLSFSGVLDAATGLQAQNGTVAVRDGCAVSSAEIVGAHQFFRFSVRSDLGRTLQLPAGLRQSISSGLELAGGSQRLRLRSSIPGDVAFLQLAVSGSQSINRVDVQDVGAPSGAAYLAPGSAGIFNSVDRGNSPRFFVGEGESIVPVPASSLITNLLLSGLILSVALATLKRRGT